MPGPDDEREQQGADQAADDLDRHLGQRGVGVIGPAPPLVVLEPHLAPARASGPTKETIRTIDDPQAKSQSGSGRSDLPTRPWAAAAEGSSTAMIAALARAQSDAGTNPGVAAQRSGSASRVDGQLGDLGGRALELDLEDALEIGREVELHRAARLDVLADVVAVDVDLVGRIGFDDELHVLALVEREIGDPADGLAVLDRDRRLRRALRACPASRGLSAAGAAAVVVVSAAVVVVVESLSSPPLKAKKRTTTRATATTAAMIRDPFEFIGFAP